MAETNDGKLQNDADRVPDKCVAKSSPGASAKVTAVSQGVPLKMFRKRCIFVAALHLVQTQPKAKPGHLPEEPYFGRQYLQPCPFILCSKLMTEHDVDEVD